MMRASGDGLARTRSDSPVEEISTSMPATIQSTGRMRQENSSHAMPFTCRSSDVAQAGAWAFFPAWIWRRLPRTGAKASRQVRQTTMEAAILAAPVEGEMGPQMTVTEPAARVARVAAAEAAVGAVVAAPS